MACNFTAIMIIELLHDRIWHMDIKGIKLQYYNYSEVVEAPVYASLHTQQERGRRARLHM